MLVSSQHLLFFGLLFLGLITSVSAPSWFMIWLGLELNLMSFIPLMISKSDRLSSEAALKYFLVQALSSAFIIMAAPLMVTTSSYKLVILMSLLLKLGAAPFHFWFPPVMENLSWAKCIILMTVQKIAPMMLISHLNSGQASYYLITISSILSAVVGALGGLNQTSLRKIFAFSSINHLSWMLISIILSNHAWMTYFLFYSTISASLALYFSEQQFLHFSDLFVKKSSKLPLLMYSMAFLSLGGLPPFSGFIPKWTVMELMISKDMIFPLLILILTSVTSLYFYLRLATLPLLLKHTTKKQLYTLSTTKFYLTTPMLSLNLSLLFIPSIFALL